MIRGVLYFLVYLFRNDRQFYYRLYNILGFLPGNISLYKIAFIHRSATIQQKDGSKVNNERLEYLGDAIFGAIVSEFIYNEFDLKDEGFMTKLRSRIVKRKHLNEISIQMGIPELIVCNPNPVSTSKHLYGNALEALIGAIYLDRGYKVASRFFKNRIVHRYIDLESLAIKDTDYKSQLIEWVQKHKYEIQFRNQEEYDGNKNLSEFNSVVLINKREAGYGIAYSKKEAEQMAAKVALSEITL